MNCCVRCGIGLSHNYLKPIYMTINEKRRRALVCFNCREILDAKEKDSSGDIKLSKVPEIKKRGDDEKAK